MKLKTLNDLRLDKPNRNKVMINALRQEAIKHIKEAQDNAMNARKKGDEGLVNFHIGEKCSMEEFFNITEEDLK